MPITSAVNFVEVLRQSRVLEPEQLGEVARLQASLPDPRSLARELIQRGWLTPYQVNQLFQDKGGELTLGQYVILERLGEGGMGLVFKGRHRRMGRTVAIKVIRKEHIAHADALRRFQREMQAVASMSHPNIVMAYDGDQTGETHYFAMEFVDGTELGNLLKRHGAMPVPIACDYLRQVALGLQHAHEKGMVHRDIKPSNLLVTRPPAGSESPWGPVVKLLDLGVARLHEPPGGVESISALTKEGRVVGTPDFMAPEQAANSAKADIRSDIYSLGCTFYCMLAAQVPFPGGTPMEKLLKHRVDKPKPVEQLRPQIPPAVAAVVRKMMAKKPEERYQTPAELVRALDAISVGGGFEAAPTLSLAPHATIAALPQAVPLGRQRRSWLLLAGLLVGAAFFGFAVVGIAFLAFGSRKATPSKAKVVNATDAAFRELAARAADPKSDAEAVRREVIRYRQEHLGTPLGLEAGKLLMRLPSPLDQLKPGNIPASERVPALIPGERQASFPAEVVAVLGQRGQRHWGAVRATAISPDGRLVASGGDDNVVRLWDAATMREEAVLTGSDASIYWLGFTSDSRTLLAADTAAILHFYRGFRPTAIEQPDWRIRLPGANSAVALSPDSQTVAYALPPAPNQPAAIQLIDLGSINRPGGKPQPRGTIATTDKQAIRALAFSTDGKTLASAAEESPAVHVWDMTAKPPKQRLVLEDGKKAVRTLAFSLEGSQLACGGADGTIRVYDLAKTPPGKPRVLHPSNLPIAVLAFVPGGRKLLIAASDRTMHLWNLAAPAPGQELVPFRAGHAQLVTSLSAAGSVATPIVISGSVDTTVRKWNVATPLPAQVPAWLLGPTGPAAAVAFLANDRTVAASNVGDPTIRLWEPLTGRSPTIPNPGGNSFMLAATPDGRALATCGQLEGRVQLRRQGDSGAFAVEDLAPLSSPVSSLAIAPDGKNVAAGSVDGLIHVVNVTDPKPWKWRTLAGHRGRIIAMAFSPDSKLLASAGVDGTVHLRALNGDKEVIAPISLANVASLAFAPDGKALVAGGGRRGSGELSVWDLANNQAKPRSVPWKRGHNQPVTAVAFTPDGERLVSAGQDGQVILHSLASGEARLHIRLAGPIRGLALASSGRYAATANGNGTVYLLRLTERPAR